MHVPCGTVHPPKKNSILVPLPKLARPMPTALGTKKPARAGFFSRMLVLVRPALFAGNNHDGVAAGFGAVALFTFSAGGPGGAGGAGGASGSRGNPCTRCPGSARVPVAPVAPAGPELLLRWWRASCPSSHILNASAASAAVNNIEYFNDALYDETVINVSRHGAMLRMSMV